MRGFDSPLVGTDTIEVALALGISPARISAIAAGPNPSGGAQARPNARDSITNAIRSGEFIVPIAATFPIERTREAVTLQRGGMFTAKLSLHFLKRTDKLR